MLFRSAKLMHKLVHVIDALALGKLFGMAFEGAFASLDHLLARILAIMLHEGDWQRRQAAETLRHFDRESYEKSMQQLSAMFRTMAKIE